MLNKFIHIARLSTINFDTFTAIFTNLSWQAVSAAAAFTSAPGGSSMMPE